MLRNSLNRLGSATFVISLRSEFTCAPFEMLIVLALIVAVSAKVGQQFPKNFLWGVSTAAYQIEGAWNESGRGPSIWDTFSQTAGNTFDHATGDVADDHYHLFEKDIALMKELGVKNYRFSISWSRIVPTGYVSDGINQEGLAWYNHFVDRLIQEGITPHICLYHWDLPQGIQDKDNGWLGDSVVDAFVDYADIVFDTFIGRVNNWFTFNEPLTFCTQGYGSGVHAPGTSTAKGNGNSDKDPYTVSSNVLKAHAKSAQLYRKKYLAKQPDTVFSIVLNSDYFFPISNSPVDQEAADLAQASQLGWFADPLVFGQYPKSMLESLGENIVPFDAETSDLLTKSVFSPTGPVFGINHYSSSFAGAVTPQTAHLMEPGLPTQLKYFTSKFNGTKMIGPVADSPWLFVVPDGIRHLLNWSNQRYTGHNVSYIITENGVDCPDENALNFFSDIRNDFFRQNYIKNYLANLLLTITEDKIDVQGYFVWSLLDNFEWADGYNKRFGIVYVDYESENKDRTPKDSFYWFRDEVLLGSHSDSSIEAIE